MRTVVHGYLDFRLDFGDPDTVAAYDELTLWSALAGQLLLQHVPLKRHVRVLDAGCGTGFPLLELAERLGGTSTVHGVDTWSEALDRARFKARVRGVENVELVRSDVASLPFPDAHFDLIVSNLGINNFAQPERAVLRMPTGHQAGRTPRARHEPQRPHERVLRSLRRRRWRKPATARLSRRSKSTSATVPPPRSSPFCSQAPASGSRASKPRVVSMRFADGSALLRHYFIKLGFLDGWKSVVREDRREEVFARLEEKLNALAGLPGRARAHHPSGLRGGRPRALGRRPSGAARTRPRTPRSRREAARRA